MGSMLEMLKESMGESKPGDKKESEEPSKSKGEEDGASGGGSDKGGAFNKYSERFNGSSEHNAKRKLEKSGGISPSQVPEEFRKLVDSYNKN